MLNVYRYIHSKCFCLMTIMFVYRSRSTLSNGLNLVEHLIWLLVQILDWSDSNAVNVYCNLVRRYPSPMELKRILEFMIVHHGLHSVKV